MIRMSIRLSFVLVLISWSTYQVVAEQNLEEQLEQLRNNYVSRRNKSIRNGKSSDWVKIGQAYGANNYVTFALESTLQLSKGDQICLFLKLGKIHEWIGPGFGPYSSFVGMLMEEDIFA